MSITWWRRLERQWGGTRTPAGTTRINDETARVARGDAIPVLLGDVHSFENTGSAKGKLDTVDVK